MSNSKHRSILQNEGVKGWNRWRRTYPDIVPNLEGQHFFDTMLCLYDINFRRARLKGIEAHNAMLEGADLRDAQLKDADLYGASLWSAKCHRANFDKARLEQAYLPGTVLNRASLRGAILQKADCSGAHFVRADLSGADMRGVDLTEANLDHATLPEANLENATLVRTSLRGTDLHGSDVYGASIWDVVTDSKTNQMGLITDSVMAEFSHDPFGGIVVDSLNVAHFIALIQRPEILSELIHATTNRIVLLLGRFQGGGKALLTHLAGGLRAVGYLPIVFDFPPPKERDMIETIKVLAGLSRFVVADLSRPRSTPLELHAIAPHLMVPIVPIVRSDDRTFAMFSDLQHKYFWVLPPVKYESQSDLLENIENGIIQRANRKLLQIREARERAVGEPVLIADC